MIKKISILFIIVVIFFLLYWVYRDPGFNSFATLFVFIAGSFFAPYIVKSFPIVNRKDIIRKKLNNQSLLKVSKLIKNIDSKVLRKTRNLNTEKVKPVELSDQYNSFFEKFSNRKKLKVEYILELINNDQFNPIISNDADFIVVIDKELKEISLQNHKGNKINIHNPKLMWECSCNGDIKENYKNCPIHKHFDSYKEAKKFSEDFNTGLVKIKYGDIELFWKNEKDLWPPSIDSFNLIIDIKINGYDKKNITSVLDIGSGTGFLGIWLAKNNLQIKQVHFSDWLLLPLFFSYANSKHNTPIETQFLLGLNTSWLPLENQKKINKYDLIICNPPYLPELGFKELTKESTVAGTQLLKSIIINGLDIGKEVIISFSELVLPEAQSAAKIAGINLNECKIGGPHLVPFRVPIALKRKNYIYKLLKERALIEDSESEFKYWHKINTYSLKRLPTMTISNAGESDKTKNNE